MGTSKSPGTTRRRRPRPKPKTPWPELELHASGLLLQHWAARYGRGRGNGKLALHERVTRLREILYAPPEAGDPTGVDFEFCADEYDVMHEFVQQCLYDPATLDCLEAREPMLCRIRVTDRVNIVYNRMLPVPRRYVGQFLAGIEREDGPKLSEIALKLTAARLGVSPTAVRRARAQANKPRARRFRTTLAQRHLMSLFWDLCGAPRTQASRRRQAMILDTLAQTGYAPVALYAMLQTGEQHIPRAIAQGVPRERSLRELCTAIWAREGSHRLPSFMPRTKRRKAPIRAPRDRPPRPKWRGPRSKNGRAAR